MSEVERPICRTCLKPKEPLVDEGGLLFCQDCLKNYKETTLWMKGGDDRLSYEQFMAEYQVEFRTTGPVDYPYLNKYSTDSSYWTDERVREAFGRVIERMPFKG